MGKKVPCIYDDCSVRIPIELFDEDVWLPVFKSTREHVGYFCADHVQSLRGGLLPDRYLLTRAGNSEIIIDRAPLEEE